MTALDDGLDRLDGAVVRHVDSAVTVPRLELVQVEPALTRFAAFYRPMVCFMIAGAKETTVGDEVHAFARGAFYVSSVEVPVSCTIVRAPFRAVVLHLDAAVLADLLLEMGVDGRGDEPVDLPRLPAFPVTDEVLEPLLRLVDLLETPRDIPVLAQRTEAELLYRLLATPAGPAIRRLGLADSRLTHVRASIGWIRAHLREPLQVEALARRAAMSPASLRRHFHAATGMSPVQFQKRMRLLEARRRLLAGEDTSSTMGAAVGFGDPSRFNREYRRQWGTSPARDAAELRTAAGAAPTFDPPEPVA